MSQAVSASLRHSSLPAGQDTNGDALEDLDVRISGLFPVVSPTVFPDAPLRECQQIIQRGGQGLALVLEKGSNKPLGVIQAASILAAFTSNPGRVPSHAREIMESCETYVARPHNLHEALKLLEARNVPILILVNPDSSFQGLVSTKDLCGTEMRRLRRYSLSLDSSLNEMREEIRGIQKENADIIGMLAHDLRGPLAGIQGLADVLARDIQRLDQKQIQEFSRIISEQTGHLLHLTRDVMELSRGRCGKLPLKIAKCDPISLVLETSQLYRELANRKGVIFEVNLPEEPPKGLMLDPERIKTVLGNLLDNAVKYCKAGETIKVSAQQTPKFFTYLIADNGQGLPRKELQGLFVRFKRGSSTPTGGEPSSGLGLAIAREIIQAHGGRISVDGDTGQGLTFSVKLPIHDNLPKFPSKKLKVH